MKAMKELLSSAIYIATIGHNRQFDKAGVPYILHCIKVMHYLKTDDEELNCIAILHDLVEDTDWTLERLSAIGMTNRIVEGIRVLTKTNDLTEEEYLEQIKANPDAIKVKMADLRHNSDIRRLKDVRQRDFDRIVKYHKMYQELKKCL